MSDRNTAFIERLAFLALCFMFLLAWQESRDVRPGTSEPAREVAPAERPLPLFAAAPEKDECRPKSECCRVCKKGKACGDSCINEKLTCRKTEEGCACDAEDLCK